jgi:hypothetical protein
LLEWSGARTLNSRISCSSLRFLLESYKLGRERFKDKKAPEDIETIVIQAEKAEPKTIDAADLDRSITEALGPEDAAVVKGDLELLSLLILPAPKLDAFNYWGMLSRLVEGLQAYARDKRLLELRGINQDGFGQVLVLHKAAAEILPKEQAAKLATPYEREGLKQANGIAILRPGGAGFPLVSGVLAEFYQYSSMGGTPGVKMDMCFFDVSPGQQPHWLKFDRGLRSSGHFKQSHQYMLEAAVFVSIVKALRDDVHDYANQILADEQKIGPLSAAIDAFVKANTKPTSK